MAVTSAFTQRARELETRHHELRRTHVMMVDGSVTANLRTVLRGLSARAYVDGYWGFASVPWSGADESAERARVQHQAVTNAHAMSGFGPRAPLRLPASRHQGRYAYAGRPLLTAAECNERLAELNAYLKRQYPGLLSTRVLIHDEHHSKLLQTESGTDALASVQRAVFYAVLVGVDTSGAPIEVDLPITSKGSLADLDWSIETLAPALDRAHDHLQAKRHAIAVRGGLHTAVLSPQLAGILAHEAVGHPCEADMVLAGAVTSTLVGQPVASDLVSMVDIAHTWNGEELMIPVYVDDEGTPGSDVVMIDRGRLTSFMHSRETAARMGQEPTGNARAYGPEDEPLVRMRNTAILPGTSKLAEMIEGVDDGYLLLNPGNGQADSTTEFMFGVTLAYEIRGGKIGRAVRDTTLSGSALKVLQAVDAVSDDMHWSCGPPYCGKKQPMVVSVGGPALRTRVQLGGQ